MLLERWGSAQYYMVWVAPISALGSTGARRDKIIIVCEPSSVLRHASCRGSPCCWCIGLG